MSEWMERTGRWLEQRERWMPAGLVVFYAGIVGAQSALKLVWADELITYYIARQNGLRGVWHALEEGADPNPPLMHVLVQWSTSLFGDKGLAMRLPAMVSGLVALGAMWWMLRRWVRPVYALAGCLAFMATRGFDYAYDARSYAALMGCSMLSLALWMAADDAIALRRVCLLAGMAIALAAGISSNYYGVLAFFPIAAGELFRRFRMGVWLAGAAGSLPLLAYLPLIWHNLAEFGPHAWNRPRASMVVWSYLELVEGMFWLVAGLGLWVWWRRSKEPRIEDIRIPRGTTRAETVALGVLLAYPVMGYLLAVGGAGMISPRCVVPVCCGFGLVAGLLGQRVFPGRRAGVAIVLSLLIWVGAREWVCANLLLEQRRAFMELASRAGQSGTGAILVGDSSFVLPLYFYSGEEVRRRIVFPVDFVAINRWEKDDSGEENLWGGRDGVFPFPVVSLDKVDLRAAGLVVIGREDGWLARMVRERGISLVMSGTEEIYDSADWYRVGGVFTPMAHEETRILKGPGVP